MDISPNRALVVYYSRTGTTRSVAEEIASCLAADLEEVKATRDRRGLWGWLVSAKEGVLGQLTSIQAPKYDPADYELLVIGTPVWGENMSSPIRTYIKSHPTRFQKVAFFCTRQGSSSGKTLKELERLWGKPPVAVLDLKEKEVKERRIKEELDRFIDVLKESFGR
ncbi:MAG TPA: flavodoxin [Bacillota bacterium]|nr:hypothetical protein [Bacillota bacterium]HOB86286.1 flavodoxin [Bacillota bacterium]HOP69130.1 flavodoxin [Bacillota bacterium]HPT33645.1 flavodoxin [Bacillota bacterium]HPZ64866.1 flavodoxin [Bacillota bacterium]